MIYKIIYIPSKPWEKTNEHPLTMMRKWEWKFDEIQFFFYFLVAISNIVECTFYSQETILKTAHVNKLKKLSHTNAAYG